MMDRKKKEFKTFLTRMDLDTYKKLRYIATRDCRSMNQQIYFLTRNCIQAYEDTHGAIDDSLLTELDI